MSSDSSASVKLDRRRIRRDPDVTLARASDGRLDTFIPMGIPLAGPSDRRVSDASSPRIDLPEHRFDDVPHKVSGDSSGDGSSYARSGGDSKVSETSNRVETEEGTSGGEKGSFVDFRNAEPKSPGPGLGHGIKLDDSNDVESSMNSSRVYALTPAGGWEGISIFYPQANDRPWSPPSGYMCVYECFIKNGGLCFRIPMLLLQYCHRRRISLSQLTHGSIRAMMAVVVLTAEHGGVVNLDEFEEISSFSPIGNSVRFYVSPRGGYQLVKGHSRQVSRHRWSRYFYVEISRRTIGEFSKPIRVGWNFLPGDFYLLLEDNSPKAQQDSNKKAGSSQRKKSSTPSKKKTVQTRPKKTSMVKLNLDVVDSDEEFELPKAAPPTVREGLRPEKAPITHGRGKGLMGGLLAESRRAEEARLERERHKEVAKRKSRAEEKKAAEAETKKKKRVDEERGMAKPLKEKKRSAQEALGSGDRVEKLARFNTVGLPVEVDHLYAGVVVRVGDGDASSSSPFDFVFDFRGGGKHISQVPLACLQFVRCVRGGPEFLSPPAVYSSSSDPDTRFAMSAVSMLAGYNFLSDARYDLDQRNRKLNTQNGDLVSESNRSKEARTRAELEAAKLKDLLTHSQQVNGELIARRDDLSSKVDALTSALAEAEEAKKVVESRIEGEVAELRSSSKDVVARPVEEVKKKAKDKLRRSIEIMEERSKAQTEADRLASLASQVVGAIRRMDKAAKDGVLIDAAKKEKLEARLASYTAEAESIVLPSLPTDSSDDEEIEPKKGVALDISSSDSSDEEGEKSEVDGRSSVAGKTLALTLAEIEEAANFEAEDGNQLRVELFGDQSEAEGDFGETAATKEPAATREPASIDAPVSVEEPAVDAATRELIAPLFADSNLEELETVS
ncbi:hypothetical protein AALP_AA4G081700 [Arabis alpina]|uniref:Uncharacterized protein n=1 Tax=Arabis alpina TaxID=50452 RepID=A0A087H1Y0_ARAAL|nr:hypothetical protein AALP_AA4G081700 [Arabis alpina]